MSEFCGASEAIRKRGRRSFGVPLTRGAVPLMAVRSLKHGAKLMVDQAGLVTRYWVDYETSGVMHLLWQ